MNKDISPEELEGHEKPEESLLPVKRTDASLVPRDPLTAYLQEIQSHEMLTEEEEHRLAVKFKEEGDLNAAYRLTTSHLMLVVRIAMTFKREWNNLMDLIQEGNVGLMKAVKNFDPFRGVRLSAYATWWIRSYMLKYIIDNWRLVKVGTTNARRKLLFNLKREKEKLEREGFAPTTKLLAERFGVDEGEVIDVEASLGAADVSMDAPVHPDSPVTPENSLAHSDSTEQQVESDLFRQRLRDKLAQFTVDLKPIETEILNDRVLSESPLSLQAIGDNHGITREAVRQAEGRLLKKLKAYLEEHLPEAAEYFKP